jgi:hypothetical protein
MPIACTCPACGRRCRIADGPAGTSVLCPACHARFRPRRKASWVWFAALALAAAPVLFGALFLFLGWPLDVGAMVAGVFCCLAGLVVGKGLALALAFIRSRARD